MGASAPVASGATTPTTHIDYGWKSRRLAVRLPNTKRYDDAFLGAPSFTNANAQIISMRTTSALSQKIFMPLTPTVGKLYVVKDTLYQGGGLYSLGTLDGSFIDGQSSVSLPFNGMSAILAYDGTGWMIIGFYPGTMSVSQEIHSSVLIANEVSLVSGSVTNITSINIPPGDWEVSGSVAFDDSSVAGSYLHTAAISTSSGTNPIVGTGNNYTSITTSALSSLTINSFVLPVGPTQVSVAATTTYYLNAEEGFGSGTAAADGFIHARYVGNTI